MKKPSPSTPQWQEVERPTGSVWLHTEAQVWVVHYPGFPESTTHRYDSWQAYRAVQRVQAGRDPWTVDNRRIGPESGFPSEAAAFAAADEFIRDSQTAKVAA